MRAFFDVLLFFTICTAEFLNSHSPSNQERFTKTKLLISKHHDNDTSNVQPFIWNEIPQSTTSNASIVATDKASIKQRIRILKQDRSNLRVVLKQTKRNRAARTILSKQIKELNAQIKKLQKSIKTRRKQRDRSTKNVFKWNLKNNLDKNVNKSEKSIRENDIRGFSKINYANLLHVESTTMPILKNVSLNLILREFNAISDQIQTIPGAKKYPRLSVSKKAARRKIGNRCGVLKGGCEHVCNDEGRVKCSCLPGFKLSANKRNCIDVNECNHANGGCKEICNNTPGSFYCACPSGLRLSENKKSCEDVNECLLRNGHGPCQDSCKNTFGSYVCSCAGLKGTRLSKDRHSCEDIDECRDGLSGCSHDCVNTLGRAYCTCPDGMELSSDWKTCDDLNECEDEEVRKFCGDGCLNTVGSYRCLNEVVQNDEVASAIPDHVACPPLFPPGHGFLECSREKGLSVRMKSKSGRTRVTNRPGTFCKLVCPRGYRHVGIFKMICGLDGSWIGDNRGKCEHYPEPKIKSPKSQTLRLDDNEETVDVLFEPPKTNID